MTTEYNFWQDFFIMGGMALFILIFTPWRSMLNWTLAAPAKETPAHPKPAKAGEPAKNSEVARAQRMMRGRSRI